MHGQTAEIGIFYRCIDIWLIQQLAVEIELLVPYFNNVAGNADHPLDQIFLAAGSRTGIMKDDNLPAARIPEAEGDFINNQLLP